MNSKTRPALDVSRLPQFGFGPRDPLWWGVVWMMCIEGTAFLLLGVGYFYIRGNEHTWPPSGISVHNLVMAAVGTGVLLASGVTMHFAGIHAKRGEIRKMRLYLIGTVLFGFAFPVFRALELSAMQFRWDDHAYGSVTYVLLGLHLFHAAFAHIENSVLLALFTIKDKWETRNLVDVEVNALYWYFVVFFGVAIFALVYLDPGALGALQ